MAAAMPHAALRAQLFGRTHAANSQGPIHSNGWQQALVLDLGDEAMVKLSICQKPSRRSWPKEKDGGDGIPTLTAGWVGGANAWHTGNTDGVRCASS